MLKKRDSTPVLPTKPFFKTWAYLLNVVVVILLWLTFAFFISRLPPEIPLWYSLPPGSSQLGTKQDLVFIPSLATACLLLSSALLLFHRSSLAIYTHILLWMTVLVQSLFFISLISIINLSL